MPDPGPAPEPGPGSVTEQPKLRRRVNLALLSFYGIGTILGAGIYVLIGKVAGYAGMQTPLAFLFAAILAGLTAFSYAELAVRFPKSAGEAIYIDEGFHLKWLSIAVGLLIVTVGMTSTATLLNGLIGYLQEFIALPGWLVIIISAIILGTIVIWGIGESVTIASVMTVVEMIGLIMVIWVARDSFSLVTEKADQIFQLNDLVLWTGILAGAFVAFYAFIGFEDMVNIAEEVKQPEKILPRGIIIALVVTTLFYFIVAMVSVLSVDPQELAQSDAPLAMIYSLKSGPGSNTYVISMISLISILNGVLIQLIMASRVLYGMSRRQWLPEQLSRINKVTHTPIRAILFVVIVIVILALALPLLSLAKITSFITLSIFTLINLSLWRIKWKGSASPGFSVSILVPILGTLACGLFILYQTITFIRG